MSLINETTPSHTQLESDTTQLLADTTQLLTDAIAVLVDTAAIIAATTAIEADTTKIDDAAVDGLTGAEDSLSYKTHEIEKHFHNRERWLGISGDQSGNNWAIDTLSEFQAISGNNAYGTDANDEAKVLGSDDTPVIGGMVKFDFRQIFIAGVSEDSKYKLQIIYGTGTMADAITAGQYTEEMVSSDKTNPQQSAGMAVDMRIPRQDAGTKIWVRAWNTVDNATINFMVGIHEYPG